MPWPTNPSNPSDKDWIVYKKENPNEHWEGRKYPEWELVKMGEADNTPGDPFDIPWDKQYEDSN